MPSAFDLLKKNEKQYLEEMVELLKIPSISPGKPHPEAIIAAADWLEHRVKKAGLDNVRQLVIDDHNPIVFGEKRVSDELPTVLFYSHYDVMPPDPLDEWETPPFDPVIRDGRLYARGSADDKGQGLMQLFAVESFLNSGAQLPCNVLFCIEGEEEMGSDGLEKLLDREPDLLRADAVIISDSPFFHRDLPSITYSLRGIATAELFIEGPNRDLHSGNYGGAVANPVEMAARIVNDLKDRDGRITIPGFYDDVVSLEQDEREALAKLPLEEDEFFSSLDVPEGYGESGYTTLERIWARPSLEINGMGGGFLGDGNKTIVPSSAFIKISMRLVANQNPDKILQLLERHVNDVTPPGVRVCMEKGHTGSPFMTRPEGAFFDAISAAVKDVYGKEIAMIRDGASIPIVNSFAEKTGAQCLLFGVDVPEGNIHSPNEMLILDNFYKGMETLVRFIERL